MRALAPGALPDLTVSALVAAASSGPIPRPLWMTGLYMLHQPAIPKQMHTTGQPAGPVYHHRDFPLAQLVAAKAGRSVSVCLPARDEETTIGAIVASLVNELVAAAGLVDEVLVVDDGSSDTTAQVAAAAGARVVAAADVLADEGGGQGKGQAMWKAVGVAVGELIVFCDADVSGFDSTFVAGLLGPLLMSDGVALVKGFYDRPVEACGQGGGRVTELVARPLISLLLPHLSEIVQPLAGEVAAPRKVLEELAFADGYGVELGLLADVAARFGVGAIAQVDLGQRRHRNRPLAELGPQATAIVRVALDRAGVGSVAVRPAVLIRPGTEPLVVGGGQRPPLVEVPAYRGFP